MDTIKKSKIRITGFDGVIGRDMSGSDEVIEVELTELYEFKDHPFRVTDDAKMKELSESIKKYGVLSPIIIRPRSGGGYEIVSGHRRKRASEIAGLKKIPAFCRNYTDAEAVVMMVDSNLQREELLPSEKAFAYKMKYEAVKKVKKRGDGKTISSIGTDNGESRKTVQNYIWLTRLLPGLMEMIDRKEVGLKQGVNLSFIGKDNQKVLLEYLMSHEIKLSYGASLELRKCEVSLTESIIEEIVISPKDKAKDGKAESLRKKRIDFSTERITFSVSELKEFFPDGKTPDELKLLIIDAIRKSQT